jgi:sugar/nucleoside kinase (ribokinase family)
MGFEKVIVTLGSQWVELREWPELTKLTANTVESVTDPTGAGDALRWWLLAWLYDGNSRVESLEQWQALAALCIQTKGTMEWSR